VHLPFRTVQQDEIAVVTGASCVDRPGNAGFHPVFAAFDDRTDE
jgi:hypothetical protein